MNLDHPPGKRPIGISVDRESDLLPHLDLPNIRFVDMRVDTHLTEIVSNGKQRRRLHAGGDGLPKFHAAPDHNAGDRGADDRALEVDLRRAQRRRGYVNRCFFDRGIGACRVQFAFRCQQLGPRLVNLLPCSARVCLR